MPICAVQNGNALFAVAQEIPSSGKEFENASYKIQYHYLNSVKYTGVIVNPNKESLFRHVRAGGNPSPDLSGIFRGCRDFKLLDSRLLGNDDGRLAMCEGGEKVKQVQAVSNPNKNY